MSPSPDKRQGTDDHDDQYGQYGPPRDVGGRRHPALLGFLGKQDIHCRQVLFRCNGLDVNLEKDKKRIIIALSDPQKITELELNAFAYFNFVYAVYSWL